MRTRAAIAFAAGQAAGDRRSRPRRPARRRGHGRDQGDRHLPHRRVHAVRRRPRGPVPGDPRARGRRRRGRGRAGRDVGEAGRPRHPALHPGMPRVPVLPQPQDQPLHRDPRDPGPGADARRHLALLAGWQADPPLHGLLDLLELHRAAGDRGGQGPRGRAVRYHLLHRLRRDHRHRRGDQHRQGRGRRQGGGVRARRHRAQRHPGAEARRRRHDHRRRPQPRAQGLGRAVRDDPLRQRLRGRRRDRAPCRQHDQERRRPDRRRRLQLRLHRQRQGDARGARVHPPRLGRLGGHRRGAGRRGDRRPGRSSWSPAGSGKAPPSAAPGDGPTCRRSSTGTWTARSRSTR